MLLFQETLHFWHQQLQKTKAKDWRREHKGDRPPRVSFVLLCYYCCCIIIADAFGLKPSFSQTSQLLTVRSCQFQLPSTLNPSKLTDLRNRTSLSSLFQMTAKGKTQTLALGDTEVPSQCQKILWGQQSAVLTPSEVSLLTAIPWTYTRISNMEMRIQCRILVPLLRASSHFLGLAFCSMTGLANKVEECWSKNITAKEKKHSVLEGIAMFG